MVSVGKYKYNLKLNTWMWHKHPLRPVQCCIQTAEQQRSLQRRRQWGADRGSCTPGDQWDA